MKWFFDIIHYLFDHVFNKNVEKMSSVLGSVTVGVTITVVNVNWEEILQAWITTGGSATIAGLIGFFISPVLKKLLKKTKWGKE